MKPRLYYVHHIWCCRIFSLRSESFMFVGYGYSPKAAYDDCQAQLRAQPVAPAGEVR